ncbi:MAG: TonB-dependent receptor plug domain-containing protein [Cyclobacteriaceae bacterium]
MTFLRLWYIAVLIMLSLPISAQVDQQSPNIIDFLSELETKHNVSFAYNYGLFESLPVPATLSDCNDFETCISQLQALTPIEVKPSTNGRYTLMPVRATAIVSVVDGTDETLLDMITVGLNDGDGTIVLPTDNHFTIKGLFPTDSVTLYSRFYLPSKMSAQDLLSGTTPVKLKADTIYLEEVVIEDFITKGVSTQLSDQKMIVNMSSLGPLAGDTDGDVLTALGTLPGVRTPSGKPGGINFRGTTFDQTMIYFDDIPIYHTGHFFGTISPYNAAVVEQIEIYRGTLPAKWGGRLGGLIDISTAEDVPEKVSGSVSLNTVYAGGSLNLPLIKDKWGLSIASRASYPIDNLSPKLEALRQLNFQGSRIIDSENNPRTTLTDDLYFGDINGKSVYQVNDRNSISVSGILIDNGYNYEWGSPDMNLLETEDLELDNWGLTSKWSSDISEKIDLNLGMSLSNLDVLEGVGVQENGQQTRQRVTANSLDERRIFLDINQTQSNTTTWSYGYSLTRQRVVFEEESLADGRPPGQQVTAFTHSAYASIKKTLSSRLITNLGVHSDYYAPLDNWVFDPRVSASYIISDNVFLKAGASQSHQYIRQLWQDDFNDFRISTEFWSIAENRIPILQGRKAMLGMIFEKERWLIDIEGYFSRSSGIEKKNGATMIVQGDLNTKGIDLFIKRRSNLVEFWLSYSLSQVQTVFAEEELAYYDQPHILNLVSILALDRWSFSLSWALMSGMPVIIPDINPGDQSSMGATALSIPYEDRFPLLHQMDFSASMKFLKGKNGYMGTIGLSVLNLYDQDNIINIFQENTRPSQPYRFAVGFAPNINLNIRF